MAKLPNTESAALEETKKQKKNYAIFDAHALYSAHPQFFKLVPDHGKIKSAIKLGFNLPGVEMIVPDSGTATNNDYAYASDEESHGN